MTALGDLPAALHSPLFIVRVLSPLLVLFSTLSIVFTHPPSPKSPSPITSVVVATRIPRRALILTLLSLASLTFLLDGLAFVVYAVIHKVWPQHTGIEISAVVGLVAFAGLAAIGTWKDLHGVDVWSLRRLKFSFAAALALDLAQVVILGQSIKSPLSVRSVLHLVFPAFRVLLLFPLLVSLFFPRVAYVSVQSEEEAAPTSSSYLLPQDAAAAPSTGLSPVSGEASKYGTFRSGRSLLQSSGAPTRTHTPTPSNARVSTSTRKETKDDVTAEPSWADTGRRLGRIIPYLWPSKSGPLQLLAATCILLVGLGRVVNFLVPLTFATLVKVFEEGSTVSPWPYLFAYVGLRFLQASGGIAALRDTLWAPVMQYSDREMSQLSFDHLLNLSFAFHMRRKTGEILRILDRGAAINHTLQTVLFNIIPTFLDIVVALFFFVVYFDWTLALVIFFVMVAYVSASIVLTRWRTQLRRQMNDRDVITRGIHTDCLLNYETVKYFGGEQYEGERYSEAIRQYQALEYKVMVSLNLLNLVQNLIITLGLLIGSMIVALRVTNGQSKPHEFVFFITYLAQLYGPLNMLGTIYRSVNQSLIDTEKLLKLLNEPTDINDKPDAPDLIVDNGEIEFDNVSFSYDGRTTALHNISFKVPKGSSVALVGESGSGKSTILRLLFRFYDLKEGEGRILIDGQDIRDVTQASLRRAIGVVPQDSVLFNASIAYNIGYGKFGASAEEIENAARAAQMHDRIMSFPDGYDTKVGERGVRLSGGEKQRVAIARTLLKNPPILLLDEATSALDTSTEKDIQKALQHLVEGRSSLSIAHRLSTIASADLILVLKDGRIVEQGSHSELLALDGIFASMWADQIAGSEDAASSHKKELTGYLVDAAEPATKEADTVHEEPTDVADLDNQEGFVVETPQAIDDNLPQEQGDVSEVLSHDGAVEELPASDAPVTFPSSDAAEVFTAPVPVDQAPVAFPSAESSAAVAFPSEDAAPIAFPSEDAAPVAFPSEDGPALADTAAPITFPASPDTASQAGSEPVQTPGVTFQDTDSPSRTGTPDPDAEGKRRRTLSTQGIQRFARRISITTRRQGSTSSIPKFAGQIIPGLKREGSSKDDSKQAKDAAVGDSPNPSVSSDIGSKKQKKDKRKSVN